MTTAVERGQRYPGRRSCPPAAIRRGSVEGRLAVMDTRPPSVDALARTLSGLPHPLLVDAARRGDRRRRPGSAAAEFVREPTPAAADTGHQRHRRAAPHQPRAGDHSRTGSGRGRDVELDLRTGERGSRQAAVGGLFARLCEAEAAIVVNNNAAAVLLVLAAIAAGRPVAVSRGESVEIGGSFRVPRRDGAVGRPARRRRHHESHPARRLRSGTDAITPTWRSCSRCIRATIASPVSPSRSTSTALADLPVPVVVDLGSGLLDARCPWLPGRPPAWLDGEPAAVQTLAAGAALVTFSGDKLLGGPQAGIIAGRADLVDRCARHPLARALRPGGLVLGRLAAARPHVSRPRRPGDRRSGGWPLPPRRARTRAAARWSTGSGRSRAVPTEAVPGAGAAPGRDDPVVRRGGRWRSPSRSASSRRR